MVNLEQLKPPLKWAGGKRWLIPELQKIWQHRSNLTLIEPFCGGLSVALGLNPEKAILNDINPHLINFYLWLKQGLTCQIDMKNDEVGYYQARQRFNKLIFSQQHKTKEAAQLFYYLNRTGFNGLCRFNQKGGFNVPFGRYKKINYQKDFSAYQKVFQNWDFCCKDFEKLSMPENSLIYADPPYDVEFRQYSAEGFSWEDQRRLAVWLKKQNVPAIASNQATKRIKELYQGLDFKIKLLEAPRRISCTGDRTPAIEILATINSG